MPDPWAEFHLEDIETEPCVRYRYESSETRVAEASASVFH